MGWEIVLWADGSFSMAQSEPDRGLDVREGHVPRAEVRRVEDTLSRVSFGSLCPSYSGPGSASMTYLQVESRDLSARVTVTDPAARHADVDVITFMQLWRLLVTLVPPRSPLIGGPFSYTFGYP